MKCGFYIFYKDSFLTNGKNSKIKLIVGIQIQIVSTVIKNDSVNNSLIKLSITCCATWDNKI